MSNLPVLLHMHLEGIPSELSFDTIVDPIDTSSEGIQVAKIQVNNYSWGLRYNSVSDLWWVSPRPNSAFYEVLYSQLFYSSPLPEQFGYATLELDSTRRTEKAVKNWDDIERNISIELKGSLLEIGCGPGEFLLEASRRGFSQVIGNELEPTSASVAESKGLTLFKGFFEELPSSYGQFDMLFADNVIEHVMDPNVFLQKAFNVLHSNGLLILRLPDTQSFGPTLKLIDHTFHFTRKSIQLILEKVGFEVVTIFYSGTFKGMKYDDDSQQRIENMTVIGRKR